MDYPKDLIPLVVLMVTISNHHYHHCYLLLIPQFYDEKIFSFQIAVPIYLFGGHDQVALRTSFIKIFQCQSME